MDWLGLLQDLYTTICFEAFKELQFRTTTPNLNIKFHKANTPQIVNILLSRGADVNNVNLSGRTPLHSALIAGKELSVIRALLSGGADVMARVVSSDVTPLHLAHTEEIVNELLSYGADVNAVDINGETPLHSVLLAGRELTVIKALVSAGADVNAEARCIKYNALHLARLDENFRKPKYRIHNFFKYLSDTDSIQRLRETPLKLALYCYANVEIIKFLLSAGAMYTLKDYVTPYQEVYRLIVSDFTHNYLKVPSSLKELKVHPLHSRDIKVGRGAIKKAILSHYDRYKDFIDLMCVDTSLCNNCIEWEQFMNDCDLEVLRLKDYVLYCNFSLFDLITRKHVKPLYITKKMQIAEILTLFPIYEDIIEEKWRQCSERVSVCNRFSKQVFYSSTKGKSGCFREVVLNADCMNRIADYLKNHEILYFLSSITNRGPKSKI